jgi:mannose-6-phosphate isomerase-like protein (cupin superfamily)
MPLQFFQGFFESRDQILDDVRDCQLWPHTYVATPTPGLDPHWHAQEVVIYLIEGQASFFDVSAGREYDMRPGDKLVIPPRALHSEGASEMQNVYIIATPSAMRVRDLLDMRSPQELAG